MKLCEFTKPDKSSTGSVKTVLDFLRQKHKTMPTIAVINAVKNTGVPFNYDNLKSMMDNDVVKKLIKSVNKDTVEFASTDAEEEDTVDSDVDSNTAKGPRDTVSKMAKRAAKKRSPEQ